MKQLAMTSAACLTRRLYLRTVRKLPNTERFAKGQHQQFFLIRLLESHLLPAQRVNPILTAQSEPKIYKTGPDSEVSGQKWFDDPSPPFPHLIETKERFLNTNICSFSPLAVFSTPLIQQCSAITPPYNCAPLIVPLLTLTFVPQFIVDMCANSHR